ncbi:MAG TPA: HupE/UreJ family protein [Pirellulales bacterium]|jgi:urease accessory protein|nr:HupE/UreJ family protein [Pirellulales bacterium]
MNNNYRRSWQGLIPALFILGSPALVYAHTGLGDASGGLISGLAHPLGGLDHLCAMIGVGLWAAQRGGRAIWLVPLAFVLVMAVGGLLGMMAISIPFVEPGIVASVLILGVLIAASVHLPLLVSVLIVGTFALFHGHAHGAEMPHTASGLMYGLGFMAATALLHFVGVGMGLFARQSNSGWLLRSAGAALVLCGIYLALPV